MSQLSLLEKLMEGEVVEWKSLGDLCKIETGKLNANAAAENGRYTFFTTAKEPSKIDKFRWDTEALLIAGNANVGEVKHFVGKFEAYQRTYVLTNFAQKVNVRYLFHVLSKNLKVYLGGRKNSAAMTYIVLSTVRNFPIPIPCPGNPEKSFKIQAEIARILDAFTELTTALTTELTTELKARKKQYTYYRDLLLSFIDTEVEWKPLGTIGNFVRGKRFTKKDYVSDNGIKAIHYGELYTYYGTWTNAAITQVRSELAGSLRYAKPNDVIIASVSETVEDVGKAVAWLGEGKVAIHDDSYAIQHSLNPKYLSYCLQTERFTVEKAKYVSRGKIKRLLIDGISKVKIPVPYPDDHERSLSEQARIVYILDKLESLTNSISKGLPLEITLRQKQYEYYRNLLLSFPKADTEVVA